MLRFVELILFLSPFLLFALWRAAAFAGLPSSRIVATCAALLIVVLLGLLWFHREGALPPDSTYVPAHLENGRVVPGHGTSP